MESILPGDKTRQRPLSGCQEYQTRIKLDGYNVNINVPFFEVFLLFCYHFAAIYTSTSSINPSFRKRKKCTREKRTSRDVGSLLCSVEKVVLGCVDLCDLREFLLVLVLKY